MRAVKAKDTKPEWIVRRLAHAMGYRYRLHVTNLPGKPDLVFPKRKKVILVHGCFWHGHPCHRGKRKPQTNIAYWEAKISRNQVRDGMNRKALKRLGWDVLVVWECELKAKTIPRVRQRIKNYLDKNA